MKKLSLLLLAVITSFILLACGSASTPSESQSNAESGEIADETESIEEILADEINEADESITIEFEGISFVVPAGAEYVDPDTSFTITFEPSKRICFILAQDAVSVGTELSNRIAMAAMLLSFEDVSNKQESNVEVAGVTGLCTIATVKMSGSFYVLTGITFTDPDEVKTYGIEYVVSLDAEEDGSDFLEFIESITFVN